MSQLKDDESEVCDFVDSKFENIDEFIDSRTDSKGRTVVLCVNHEGDLKVFTEAALLTNKTTAKLYQKSKKEGLNQIYKVVLPTPKKKTIAKVPKAVPKKSGTKVPLARQLKSKRVNSKLKAKLIQKKVA